MRIAAVNHSEINRLECRECQLRRKNSQDIVVAEPENQAALGSTI
jgi:hypothetical protein